MTSYGIEWDTNLLVFMTNDKKTNIYDIVKKPFYDKDNIQITLEQWKLENKIDDCFLSLEIQFGVFNSEDKDKFEYNDKINQNCLDFRSFWENIIKEKKIKIFNQDHHVLIYSPTEGEFSDCSLTKKLEQPNLPGYTQNIDTFNVLGRPQMTIGIDLSNIISLFAYTTEIIHNWQEKNKEENKLPFIFLLIGKAYTEIGIFCAEQKIIDYNIIAFLILFHYFFLVFTEFHNRKLKTIFKFYFLFKPRTNLRIIYDNLENINKKNILSQYFLKLSNREFEDIFKNNLEEGWILKEERSDVETNFPSMSIVRFFGNNDNNNFTKVRYFTDTNDVDLIEKKNNSYFLKEKGVLEIGEWGMDKKNNKIFIEIRDIGLLLTLDSFYRSGLKIVESKMFNQLNIDSFCEVIKDMVDFLNRAFKEAKKEYIIPPENN